MSNQPPYGGPPSGKTKTLGLDYNVAALLCYVPCCINLIASILWLATEPKESKLVRFHSLQSLLLIGVFVVGYVVLFIIGMVLGVGTATVAPNSAAGAAASAGGLGIMLIIWILYLAAIVGVSIMGMIKAYQGQIWKLPVIGNIADK